MGKGHIFGMEDIIGGRDSTTSVRCYSNSGTVLKIDAELFLREVNKYPDISRIQVNLAQERDKKVMRQIKLSKSVCKDWNNKLTESLINEVIPNQSIERESSIDTKNRKVK